MTDRTREGGCLCGAVRYSVPWPPLMLLTCACRNCQKQSGAAVSVVGAAPRDGLTITGALKTYEDKGASGKAVYRQFCPECGSPVLTDTPGAVEQEIIFYKAGTLDNTTDLAPTVHCWTGSGQKWVKYPDVDMVMVEQEGLG